MRITFFKSKLTIVCLFAGLCVSSTLVAQKKYFEGQIKGPSPDYADQTLDQSCKTVYYRFSRRLLPGKEQPKDITTTVLQIGDNYVKFADLYRLKRDSLEQIFSIYKHTNAKRLNTVYAAIDRIAFKHVLLLNREKKQLLTRARFWTYTYDYYTPMPQLNWQLKSAQKTILGHPVHLATVTYGGRTWNAWYAVDLKMPFGPYVFYGLPGLILEMTDTETNFHFIATRISTAPQKCPKKYD